MQQAQNLPTNESSEHVSVDSYTKRMLKAQQKKSKLPLLFIVCLMAATMGSVYILIKNSSKTPLDSLINDTSFSLYYPDAMPTGYEFKQGSVTAQDGVIFFTITSQDKVVYVSEQRIPEATPNLDEIPGFRKLSTPAGLAALGKNNEKTTGIILTATSIITITGDSSVPSDVVARLLENMTIINK